MTGNSSPFFFYPVKWVMLFKTTSKNPSFKRVTVLGFPIVLFWVTVVSFQCCFNNQKISYIDQFLLLLYKKIVALSGIRTQTLLHTNQLLYL
jgi:hypothetical protein